MTGLQIGREDQGQVKRSYGYIMIRLKSIRNNSLTFDYTYIYIVIKKE